MIDIYRKDGTFAPSYLARLRPDFTPAAGPGPYATCLACDLPLTGEERRRGLHPACEGPYQDRTRGEAKSPKLDAEIDAEMRAFIRRATEADDARKRAELAPPKKTRTTRTKRAPKP